MEPLEKITAESSGKSRWYSLEHTGYALDLVVTASSAVNAGLHLGK